MLKASLQLSREMNAEQIKASRELNAEQIKASEASMKMSQESNAKLLEASILQLGEKARLIAENESHKTHREYSVRHVYPL